MIIRIAIPQMFENMEEATIGIWLKREGEIVREGDTLCELITEKTTFELPAEGEGVLLRIAAPEKSIVPVGFIIGVIGDSSDELPDIDAFNAALRERPIEGAETPADTLRVPSTRVPSTVQTPIVAAPLNESPSSAAASGSRVRATPAARRAARERGMAIEDVAAAFPGKVLSEDDVTKFAQG